MINLNKDVYMQQREWKKKNQFKYHTVSLHDFREASRPKTQQQQQNKRVYPDMVPKPRSVKLAV